MKLPPQPSDPEKQDERKQAYQEAAGAKLARAVTSEGFGIVSKNGATIMIDLDRKTATVIVDLTIGLDKLL